jgi:hypothetical protein
MSANEEGGVRHRSPARHIRRVPLRRRADYVSSRSSVGKTGRRVARSSPFRRSRGGDSQPPERGETPPLCEAAPTAIRVFVSGHTHAPSLTHFGNGSALINSGCWLRQLQRFVLTLARHRCSSLASCRPTYVSTGRRLALRSSSGNIRVRPSSAFWESNASRWRAASPRNQTILHRACGSGRRFRSSRKAYCVQ